jgi:hypothetical protein
VLEVAEEDEASEESREYAQITVESAVKFATEKCKVGPSSSFSLPPSSSAWSYTLFLFFFFFLSLSLSIFPSKLTLFLCFLYLFLTGR